jgi:hypothetical protein
MEDLEKGSIVFDHAVDIVRKWDEVNKNYVSPIGLMYVMRLGYGRALSIMGSLCENHIVRKEQMEDGSENAVKYHIITKEELAKKFPDEQWYVPKHKSDFDYDLAKESI